VALLGEPGIHQQLQGPVHGRVADAGVLGADLLVQLLARDVPLGREEYVQDRLALPRALEVVILEVPRQRLALDFVRKRSFPWPPEPIRCIAVQLTQRGLAHADKNEGRRGLWLRMPDFLGLGFDS